MSVAQCVHNSRLKKLCNLQILLCTHYAHLYPTIDINECDEGVDVCAQNCVDTEGSYNCSCNIGYTLANDGVGCNGKNLLLKESVNWL